MKPLMPFLTTLILVASPVCALVEGEFLYEFGANFFQSFIGYPAVNEEGHIIVGKSQDNQILIFDSCGNFLFDINTDTNTGSVAVNFDGQILGLSSTGIAYVFSPQGELLFSFGTGIISQFSIGACFNEAGEMLICDNSNNQIHVFDSCGNLLLTFGSSGSMPGQFMSPRGICTDSDGNIYVSDTNNNRVQVFDANGNFIFSFGSPGNQPSQFMNPQGIAISPFGEIAVADTNNNRVQVFDTCGNLLKILLGSPIIRPFGVAFNEDGILYITNQTTTSTVLAYR